jgi:hypothetical protein
MQVESNNALRERVAIRLSNDLEAIESEIATFELLKHQYLRKTAEEARIPASDAELE